ncbi:pilin [Diaphorobacter caeni]|uniref:pilin n=1 Tax=Diaphorobacter caeni TaxID=2784387 RepID=UPI00188DCD97|nr:hypothetical protein [Diaphorobacter caeni]MBF5004544.1 hypothetical protein [Diaphorobacter caeni]
MRKYILRRPFASVHWGVPLVFFVCWIWLVAASQCKDGPLYPELAFVVTVTCSVIWINWLGTDSDARGWRRWGEASAHVLYDLLSFALICFVGALALTVLMPAVQCYTARAYVGEVLHQVAPQREMITANIERTGSLDGVGKGVAIAAVGRLSGGRVTDDGRVMLFMADPAASIFLEPRIDSGKVAWKCTGFPVTSMPALCRIP